MFIVLVRTVILYLLIVAGLRLLGKRQLGQLEPSELTLALLIADLASVPMQDNGIPLLTGVIPILVLLSLATILSVLSAKSIRFRALLCGKPCVIISNGQVQVNALRRTRLTVNELLEELRIQGYTDLHDVKFAVLETNGQLSILPYATQKPATAAQVNAPVRDFGLPVVLVSDGRLLSSNLSAQGRSTDWLQKQLRVYGLNSPEQVFLFTSDELGNTCCVPMEGVQ